MLVKLALRLNRANPPHELVASNNGYIECAELQNYIIRNNRCKKIGGTEKYNAANLLAKVPWVHRSYHKRGDGTFKKVAFCFSNGSIYAGDDVAGTLTSKQSGFSIDAIPMSAAMQVSGNSILYFMSGEDDIYKYDGNINNTWELTDINTDLGRIVESAAVHLDRFWYISKNSSILAFSRTLFPEDFSTDSDEFIVGQETDSIIRRCVVGAGETLYVFKNQSIWQLYGRTPSSFQLRMVTDKYGLASKRGICAVGSGFVFLDEFTKELYFFGGSEASITPLTESTIKLREILDVNQINNVDMCVHDGLFRFAFKHVDDSIYQDRELIYPINEPAPDGIPKWTMSKGAKVLAYSVWNQQGDNQELVTGRSDAGHIMYHNRTHNFDNVAISTIIRTGDIVVSEDKVMRFKGFVIKGKPTSDYRTVTFEYLLNARLSTSGSGNIDLSGERRQLMNMQIPTQVLFNTRIVPDHNRSIGNSISFQITDSSIDLDLELYSIAFDAYPRYKIRNDLVGI